MERGPRRVVLALGEAEGVARGLAETGEGYGARPPAAQIVHDEAHRPAYRRVGRPARAERAHARVDAEPSPLRLSEDEERRYVHVGGLQPEEDAHDIEDGLYGGQHHREVFRLTTRHH